jgi:hypothetical protein
MAGDLVREKPGDGADIQELTREVRSSDVRNGTHRLANISPKKGAMSVSIARRNAQAKADARVPIVVVFGMASTQAMTSTSR